MYVSEVEVTVNVTAGADGTRRARHPTVSQAKIWDVQSRRVRPMVVASRSDKSNEKESIENIDSTIRIREKASVLRSQWF